MAYYNALIGAITRLGEGSAVDVSAILTSVGSVFTQCITWIGNILTFVLSQPLFYVFLGIAVLGRLAISALNYVKM